MHLTRWLQFLVKPRSRDNDRRRREFILNVILISSITIATAALVTVIIRFFSLGAEYIGEPPLFAAIQVAVFVVLWILSRKGLFVPAAYAVVIIFLFLAFFILFQLGVLMPQGVLLLSLVVVMSSILLGTRAAAVITITASTLLITLGGLQQSGKIAVDRVWMGVPGGATDAIGFSLILAIILTVSWLSNRELERFNITLQDQVHKATARLRAANKNLKVLDKTKDEFLSMASHQLGTPLTAIVGYLSMALDDDKSNMTPSQRQYIEYAMEASERMGAMSSDLLNVSRLSAGRFVIRREPVDLVKMVEQEIEQLHPTAERKGLELSFAPPAEPLPLVPADVSKTRQVIMNFIDNAIYYTDTGSIKVKLERQNDTVVFTVTDTGIGVPAEEKAKLFSKFYRAANAKTARPDGTGLGLYLAKRVIEDQGGTIVFESEIGKGSTFGFILLLNPPKIPAPHPATDVAAAGSSH